MAFNPLAFDLVRENTLIKDERILQTEYIPKRLLHREKQIDELIEDFKKPLLNRPFKNLMIHGKSGTGKTVTIFKIVEYLQDVCENKKLNNIKVFYISCKLSKTLSKIMKTLCTQANKYLGSKINLNTDETVLFNQFINEIDKKVQHIIIIFDEIDKLKSDEDKDWIMGNFSGERLKKSYIGLVCIANDTTFEDRLKTGTMNRFGLSSNYLFPSYTKEELIDIIKDRISKSLNKNVISDELINEIAEYTSDINGEARTAIELLRESANVAEKSKHDSIMITDINKAKDNILQQGAWQDLRNLSTHEKYAYLSLCFCQQAMSKGLNQKELFHKTSEQPVLTTIENMYLCYALALYSKNIPPVSERQFRYYFQPKNSFAIQGLIKIGTDKKRDIIYLPTLSVNNAIKVLGTDLNNEGKLIDKLVMNPSIIRERAE